MSAALTGDWHLYIENISCVKSIKLDTATLKQFSPYLITEIQQSNKTKLLFKESDVQKLK